MEFSPRSDVEPVDPSSVPFDVMEINTNQYFQVAAVTVLLYDTIITMDKEVKYFWRCPKKTVNVVYFLNRYIGLLGAVCFLFWSTYRANMPLCLFAQWTRNLANYITIISIDYVLMIRVLALYYQNNRLSICLKALLLLEAILKFVAFIFVTRMDDVVVARLARDVTACSVDGIPQIKWAILDWVIPLAYGFILMLLAIYKAAAFWKVSAGLTGFPLVKVLIQDQLIYFTLVAFCCAMNLAEFKIEVSNDFLAGVLEALGNPSFLCVLGSRMLVNLKEAGERGFNEGTSYRMKSISELHFS